MDGQNKQRRAHTPATPSTGPTTRRGLSWPVACWAFILAAIGIVQIVRLQWFDASVFTVATLGVVLAAHARTRARPGRLPLSTLAGTTAILGAILCFLPRHGIAMQIIVIVAGLAAVALAWLGAGVARPVQRTSAGTGIRHLAWWWGAILVTGCLWELTQFILGLVEPAAAWFSLSDLLNPAVATVPGRIVFIVLWVSGGAWLLRRGGAR